jgi:hypothetical protein
MFGLDIKKPTLPICIGKVDFRTSFHYSKNERDVFNDFMRKRGYFTNICPLISPDGAILL